MLIDWDICILLTESLTGCPLQRIALPGMELFNGLPDPVCLCDDDTISGINREYRGIPSSTDVLSFPSVDYPVGQTAGSNEHLLRMEYDDQTGACFLGDIFISVPHMKTGGRIRAC